VREPKSDGPAAAAVVDLEERKQRVLHTRVPVSLDRHIKRRARRLGMSVSTVVRNVLLTTFGLVEDIVTDSGEIVLAIAGDEAATARRLAQRRRPVAAEDAAAGGEVVAWQEAVLNLNAVCERCNAILQKGVRAAVGVGGGPGRPPVICRACVRRLEGPEAPGRAP
jgi:hypothetical protein